MERPKKDDFKSETWQSIGHGPINIINIEGYANELEKYASYLEGQVKACGISDVSGNEGKLCDICEENKACTITRACRSCDEHIINGEHY